MGCAKGTIKLLLHVFNLVIVIAALALIVVGVVYMVNLDEVTPDEDDTLSISNIFIVVVGAIIFVIAFLGCCGAMKENKCFLMLYGIILIVLLLAQIGVGIYAFLEIDSEDELKATLKKTVQNAFDKYDEESSKKYLNTLQQNLECCGVISPADWIAKPADIPNSCCPEESTSCTLVNAYKKGCAEELFNYVQDSTDTIGYVAIGLCLVEFIPAVFAFWLRSMID